MYKRLRKEYNAFSLYSAFIINLPRPWWDLFMAVVGSFHGRGRNSSRPWRSNYIGSKDKLYQGEKQSIPTCCRYLYALFYLIDIGQGRIKLFYCANSGIIWKYTYICSVSSEGRYICFELEIVFLLSIVRNLVNLAPVDNKRPVSTSMLYIYLLYTSTGVELLLIIRVRPTRASHGIVQ